MKACLEQAAPLFKVSDSQVSSCWLLHKDAPEVENFVKVGGAKND
jgi:oligopeptide transport system ATP-binding protein